MFPGSGLSLDQAPPLGVPLRFFLTAPLYATLGGLLLAWNPEPVLASRWSPEALALTHLITLGFLTEVMCGALLQLLPVLAGAPVPSVRLVAATVHALLTLGTGALALGLATGFRPVLLGGAAAAALGLALFLAALAAAAVRARLPATRGRPEGPLALAATAVLGLTLAAGLTGTLPLLRLGTLIDLHVAWGLAGWMGLTLVGLLMELLPMFYMSPPYPGTVRRWLAPLLLLSLVFWSAARWWSPTPAMAALPVAVGFGGFLLLSARALLRRKRKIADVTLGYLTVGLASAAAGALAWILGAPAFVVGVLLLAGVAVAFPSAMLHKIVPFLCWFHLQALVLAAGRPAGAVPTMKGLLPERLARRQLWSYLAALAALVAAPWGPDWVARLAGLLFACASLLLFANLAGTLRRFRRGQLEIQPFAREPPPA
jgi:hypothetical protein